MAVSPSALEDAWGNGGDELMTDEHHPIIDHGSDDRSSVTASTGDWTGVRICFAW